MSPSIPETHPGSEKNQAPLSNSLLPAQVERLPSLSSVVPVFWVFLRAPTLFHLESLATPVSSASRHT